MSIIDSDIKGRTAIVTGAGSGVGRAVALALAGEGADVGLVGRTSSTLDETAAEIRRAGGTARNYSADLADEGSVSALVDRWRGTSDAVDILVHAAGTYEEAVVERAPFADLDLMSRTNLRPMRMPF